MSTNSGGPRPDRASPLHGLSSDAIEADDGALVSKVDRKRRADYAAIVARSERPEISVEIHTQANPDRDAYSVYGFGAVFARIGCWPP